ncbi:hypothetical protein OO006_11535 [Prosthecochloris sp. SCSIO W1101]|uniref:hypothetical protein n=1 Tax=Prosthecochloris sp. SCSIO W1101 TaxID=2992242 RepID=UPI00223D930C|nr:hypothetical protein [Prosthecochloris sp. SCSIO W1101]UZJ40974.1 hypothetical protein OO006_11535 [Prosthecochloris sp. SCSIO W1101]
MIATTIGRAFLNVYNEKFRKNFSAKEFFDDIYFEYFFNHSKYMQWITNSPFVQMKSSQKACLLKPEERIEKLENLHQKISDGEKDASIAIGFPAAEEKEFATTSGSVTDIELHIEAEDLYLSWIGGGLGIGVAGGYSIFFNKPEILLKLFEGWMIYRKYLNDPTLQSLRGNQINTWNGQWLNFAYGKQFRDDFDFARLHTLNVFSVSEKVIEVNTVKWSELFFNISNKFPAHTFNGYVYSLGQTNKTLGFYPFYFSQAKKVIDYYKILFGEQAALDDREAYESLFGLHIKRACELGVIGLQALEPKELKKYYGKDSSLKLIKPKITQKKEESEEDYKNREKNAEQKDYERIITFRTYKTWLLAMITNNKEESLKYTAEIAAALHEYREAATKNDRKNLIQSELLAAKSKKPFLDALTTLIKDADESRLEMFKRLRDKVHLMSAEDFGYFVVLLKFDYAYEERERN